MVLGQAKCEKLDSPTSGVHIARLVARLRRGWIGAYVTTSYFSERMQREVIEDAYPVVLINGRRIATEVLRAVHEWGLGSVEELLQRVDSHYERRGQVRRAEEILLDT